MLIKFLQIHYNFSQKLAIDEADRVGALLVLANDPDGDRFIAAEKQQEFVTNNKPLCLYVSLIFM